MKTENNQIANDREHCPKCGKSHHMFINSPSMTYRIASCGQRFVLADPAGVGVNKPTRK